ncbi:hypothetical protein HU200_051443 [Digitaria exilis]|uniref:PGG domain-containing protein n=1 Tax=Digitaria exilis TaxID=1010633 RepID=A0A835AQ32_9POAL|nr:hypothetical protein HU200_051443 [Digitaria exilis]
MARCQYGLDSKLLRALTSGDEAVVEELLMTRHGDGHSRKGGLLLISVQLDAATTDAAAPPRQGEEGPSGLHGVTTSGSTALHLVASRGHAGLARRVCELAPSLVAARDGCLETPLHHAAKAGHREVAACLLSAMRRADADATLRATNRLGATALYEAVRNGHAETVELLATEAPELAALTTDDGVSPLYLAAMTGSAKMGPALLSKADSSGKTPLHYAVSHGQDGVLLLLLNAEASLARVSDNQGLFPNPRAVVKNCLYWTRAPVTLGTVGDHVHLHSRMSRITPATDEDHHKDIDGITATTTIASVLIATVTFAAVFTVPGGYVADDHPRAAGTAVLARRFAFRAFVASDALAFLCSIVATCFLVYGGARQVPPAQRRLYQWPASGLLPPAAQLMVAAFAFGVHAVLGEANRWLVTLIYVLALAAVLLCFPGIWAPLYVGKAIWRRAGWRGLINVHRRPASFQELFWLFTTSFLFKNLVRPLLAVLIAVAFLVSVALNIALPDY